MKFYSRGIAVRVVGLMLLVFLCLGAFHPARAIEELPDLVRINVDPDDLGELAGSGLLVYARLYTVGGQIALLVSADTSQQKELRRLGFSPEILKRDAARSSYYLLYGLPEDLNRVGVALSLLALEGRQAVAAPSQAQLALLDSLGIAYKPLVPQPLVMVERLPIAYEPIAMVSQPDPLVQEMINQVSATVQANSVGDLSGEWAVSINGAPFTLLTRYSLTDTYIQKATRYAYERFVEMGLPAGYHYYSLYGSDKRNVHAIQAGVTQPERQFLLTAHLDSYSTNPYNLAPGADDNASGSAGVLAAARILSQYRFGCTLRYVLFTGEEQGMIGSAAFAQDLVKQPDTQVAGVLNLDMIGYNSLNTPATMELHVRTGNAADLQIASLFQSVVSTYGFNLTPKLIQPGNTFSDHSSFWNLSIPAILAIEDWSDHTPSYHQTTDRLNTLNISYLTEFSKAALATLAHMGCLLDEGVLAGTVRDATTASPLSGASVRAELDPAHVWTITTGADGSFQLLLMPGEYQITVAQYPYFPISLSQIGVFRAREHKLNIDLQSCDEGMQFTYSPMLPAVGESITFTAVGVSLPPAVHSWDFGDGSHGEGQTVTHVYSAPGLYAVSLENEKTCPSIISHRSIPVQMHVLFFPFVPVSK